MGAEIKGAIRRFIMQQMSHIKAAQGRPSPSCGFWHLAQGDNESSQFYL